jgi:hypothetical protein
VICSLDGPRSMMGMGMGMSMGTGLGDEYEMGV